MKETGLNEIYTDVCTEYIRLFTENHGCKSTEWLNGIGSILEVDFGADEREYFNLGDIRYDIDNNIKVGLIRDYMDNLYESGFVMDSYEDYLNAKALTA